MTFLNLSLLLGSGLIAVPILLHMMMRQQPKPMVFPAFRFLRQRRESNQRRLRLRHWVLLALRCLVIAALATMLARPSVASAAASHWALFGMTLLLFLIVAGIGAFAAAQRKGRVMIVGFALAALGLLGVAGYSFVTALRSGGNVMLGNQEAPVAVALVIDTSPRMEYRHENQSRLELARETAVWLTKQFPRDSEIAVLDASPGPVAFAVDLAAAHKSLERLQPTGTPTPLTEVAARAIELVRQAKKTRREVYVLTDLSKGAWSGDALNLQRSLAEAKDTQLYVFDVGAKQPQNFSLGELTLSNQVLPRGGELVVRTELSHMGPGGKRAVECVIEDPDPTRPVLENGKLQVPAGRPRGREICDLPANGAQIVEFRLRGLELGTHQGVVRIVGEDGLAIDDQRYFTIEVKDAWPVLVVAPPGVVTKYLTEAIAPYEFRETGQARFQCKTVAQGSLPTENLGDFAAVLLIDPAPLVPPDWERLATYVEAGGGLGVFLGHNAQPPEAFQVAAAKRLLGGAVARQWRSAGGDLYLSPTNFDHPVTAPFRQTASSVPWDRFPVYRHWELTALEEGTRTILSFSNNKPAIVERAIGRGKTLTMTTPISDPARPTGRTAWNELPTGDDAWPYFVLANEIALHLVGSGDTRLNYTSGQVAVLPHRADRDPERFQLFTPVAEIQDVTARDGRLTVKFTDLPGAYRLKGFRGEAVIRGFSANLPATASDLTRLTREQLDTLLGPGRFRFAANKEEINRDIGEARVGREFYPYLLLALVVLLACESLMSNKFYGVEPQIRA